MNALDDITIVDLSRILAGPYCAQLLADYGADVIKVEQPGTGDGTRQWGPPWVGEHSAYFLSANRNKRSLALDLKSPQGIEIARALIARSDVVIENFMPDALERLGLGYPAARALNPGVIYCSITGYGQTGPERDRPGFDFVIQAEGGLMSITGPVDGEPHKVGVAITDVVTGLFAANAILAALHHRERTGEGQHIDVALLDAQIAALVNVAHNTLATGEAPGRYGNAHANIVPYQSFVTRDGYIALAVGNDAQFSRLCAAIGRNDLGSDARYATNPARVAHRDALVASLDEVFRTRDSAAWLALLREAEVPAGAIGDVRAALSSPQAQAREMVKDVAGVPLLGPVAKLSATPAAIRSAPPRLGEHSEEILRELGYDHATIARLRAERAVG